MKRWWWTVCTALVVGACGEETPTSVGSGLLAPDAIETFEIVLDADRFMVWDTAFGQYSAVADAGFAVLATDYQDALDSRVLMRYSIPSQIVVIDSLGTQRTDSNPIYFGGELRVVIDTTAANVVGDVEFRAATESWDRVTTTWTARVDSTGVHVPWTEAGGSPGEVIAAATIEAGMDTLILQIDSATIAEWADSANIGRAGGVLIGTTPGMRIRVLTNSLRLRARSTLHRDTVFETQAFTSQAFIYTPEPADVAGSLRVGGTPSWRGLLRLQEGLDTVTVPCPGTNCRVRLGDVTINHAALILQPVPAPAGFDPEFRTEISVHLMLPSTLVPLERSPLTEAFSGLQPGVPGSSFIDPDAPPVEMPITEIIRLAVRPEATVDNVSPTHIAMLQFGSLRPFGFATFAERPRLRLVVSVAKELKLP